MNNYEIMEVYKHLLDAYNEATDSFDSEKILNKLIAVDAKREEKISQTLRYRRHLEDLYTACKNEIQRLKNKLNKYETYLINNESILKTLLNEGEKFDNGVDSITWRKSESIEWTADSNDIPVEFKTIKTEVVLSKSKAKEYLDKNNLSKTEFFTLLKKDNLIVNYGDK